MSRKAVLLACFLLWSGCDDDGTKPGLDHEGEVDGLEEMDEQQDLLDQDVQPPPCDVITFRYLDENAQSVWLTGSFTLWASSLEAGALALEPSAQGLWSLTLRVEPTGHHEYKFIVDGGSWIHD
ncbi:MAG: glycogen-binding domain-containing protein, partial [Myxococcota bacterium]|nr:glycogen-binding domain-containing protein [Myxococcota bacterium]